MLSVFSNSRETQACSSDNLSVFFVILLEFVFLTVFLYYILHYKKLGHLQRITYDSSAARANLRRTYSVGRNTLRRIKGPS